VSSNSQYPYTSSGTPYRYQYYVTPTPPEAGRVTTSGKELGQITAAALVLTLDFVLILYGGGYVYSERLNLLAGLPLWLLATAAATSLTAFVCHELAHKISAQRRGYWAEFRWAPVWLLFSIFTSYFAGFLFAAPGATVVGGMGDPREWARTSLAGPLTNMGFAAAFFGGAAVLFQLGNPYFVALLVVAYFNAFFGAFNLVPFGPLDGAKVFGWSKSVWVLSFLVAAAEAVVVYLVLFVGVPLL
jgi:Zn-dependent protease